MKKFFAAMSFLALINFGTCSAETIHAVGHGNTERMAIHNAMRAAVEKKFGAVVNSKTLVKNSMLVSDENSVDSAGFVSSWKIISSRVENGIFVVEILAELDDKKISSRTIDKKLSSTSTRTILAWRSSRSIQTENVTPKSKTKLFPRSNVRASRAPSTRLKSAAPFNKEFYRRRATMNFAKLW